MVLPIIVETVTQFAQQRHYDMRSLLEADAKTRILEDLVRLSHYQQVIIAYITIHLSLLTLLYYVLLFQWLELKAELEGLQGKYNVVLNKLANQQNVSDLDGLTLTDGVDRCVFLETVVRAEQRQVWA